MFAQCSSTRYWGCGSEQSKSLHRSQNLEWDVRAIHVCIWGEGRRESFCKNAKARECLYSGNRKLVWCVQREQVGKEKMKLVTWKGCIGSYRPLSGLKFTSEMQSHWKVLSRKVACSYWGFKRIISAVGVQMTASEVRQWHCLGDVVRKFLQ